MKIEKVWGPILILSLALLGISDTLPDEGGILISKTQREEIEEDVEETVEEILEEQKQEKRDQEEKKKIKKEYLESLEKEEPGGRGLQDKKDQEDLQEITPKK